MKKIVLTEKDVTNLVKKSITKKLNGGKSENSIEGVSESVLDIIKSNPEVIVESLINIHTPEKIMTLFNNNKDLTEGQADANEDGVISPKELYDHFDLDGDGIVTMEDYASHVDFHCENPDLLQPYRGEGGYIEKMDSDRSSFVNFFKLPGVNLNEQEFEKLPVDDIDFEVDENVFSDIHSHKGPMRSFRGSIYYDGVVPETDDREYDRMLAEKILDFERSKMSSMETYVGGVGFKQKSLMEPFDNMDF